MQFHKYQGTGNDFVIVDDREGIWDSLLSTGDVVDICDRRCGVGADGLILLSKHETLDFRMTYYNSDGYESSMCGNGGRCLVEFAHSLGVFDNSTKFEAIDGNHEAIRDPLQVRLKMNHPTGYRRYSDTQDWIDTGSPHLLNWSEKEIDLVDIQVLGAKWRHHERFAPDGTNVNYIKKVNPQHLKVRTFERGVEAETLSCGTGVTACAYVNMIHEGLDSGVTYLETPGGLLKVDIQNRNTEEEEVWLIGPATFVFSGEIELDPYKEGEY